MCPCEPKQKNLLLNAKKHKITNIVLQIFFATFFCKKMGSYRVNGVGVLIKNKNSFESGYSNLKKKQEESEQLNKNRDSVKKATA